MYRKVTKEEFCKMVDHSILRQYNPRSEIDRFCDEAVKYGFASVCVMPCEVAYAKKRVDGRTRVATVIGYPMGANTTKIKIAEAMDAIDNGADDLDVVINITRLLEKDYDYVRNELKEFVKAVRAKKDGILIKVIIEVYYLDNEEDLRAACELVIESGADYVKQASGYAPNPYKNTCGLDNIKKLYEICGDRIPIKSAGVPLNLPQCVEMAEHYNVSRFGTVCMPAWLDEMGDAYWENR